MVLFAVVAVLAAAVLNVEATVRQVQLNGRNRARVSTGNQKCCDSVTREVTQVVVAVLYDKSDTRTNFGKSFDKRMAELDQHDGDQKGHILASVLGGPAETWNLAPQAENVNKKVNKNTSLLNTWYDCEKWTQKQLEDKADLPIKIKLELTYNDHGGCRPNLWSISANNEKNNGCEAKNIHNGVDPSFAACQRPRG